ncbi:MORN repeat-containing protein [Bernardetia sp.]|uniref:MORN repeat-containing protein n=1 Tax=Bernardetia sp. TaxID=1937974 RepID=UPI0025BE8A0E|nr:hypothetical protein [Bernardetia sp.]
MKKIFWISLFSNVLLLVGLVWFWSHSSSTEEKLIFKTLKTSYQEYLKKANLAFFEKNYQKSFMYYSLVDSLTIDTLDLEVKAKYYVQSQEVIKGNLDSLKYILKVAYTGSMEKEEALRKLQEEIVERDRQIDTLHHQLDETNIALHDIEEVNQTLSHRLEQTAEDKYQVLDFTNKENTSIRYYGRVENDKANGFGIGIFETGGIYEGNWKNNLPNGKGRYEWKNEDVYEGNYVEGRREGYGVYIFSSQIRYEGDWVNNLREGRGKMYSPEGQLLLDGDWMKDKFQKNKKKKD